MNNVLTPRAKRVLALASQLAKDNGHTYVGSEHILLAALADRDGIISGLINAAGLNQKELCEKVTKAAKDAWGTPAAKMPDLKHPWENAWENAWETLKRTIQEDVDILTKLVDDDDSACNARNLRRARKNELENVLHYMSELERWEW